jgi:hypothetical protein
MILHLSMFRYLFQFQMKTEKKQNTTGKRRLQKKISSSDRKKETKPQIERKKETKPQIERKEKGKLPKNTTGNCMSEINFALTDFQKQVM